MKINPISFQLNSNIRRDQNQMKSYLKVSDNSDTFTLSFGKKEEQKISIAKEFRKTNRMINSRKDFSLDEQDYLKWVIRQHFHFEKKKLSKKNKASKQSPDYDKKAATQAFKEHMKDYTDFAQDMLQIKRLYAKVIAQNLLVNSKNEYKEIGLLLAKSWCFPPEKIAGFCITARNFGCDKDKLKQMIEQDIFSEERLLQDTKTV